MEIDKNKVENNRIYAAIAHQASHDRARAYELVRTTKSARLQVSPHAGFLLSNRAF